MEFVSSHYQDYKCKDVHCPGCLQPLLSRTNQLTSKWSYSEWTTLINNSIQQQAEAGMPKAGLPQGKSHRKSWTIYSVNALYTIHGCV